jgi:hypothetical protein
MTGWLVDLRVWRYALSGVLAGALAAVSFAWIHALFISDIWYSIEAMMVAGGLCGLAIALSYGALVKRPSFTSWLRYNALLFGMLALLGLTSELLFEPVTTIPALLQLDGPPTDLFAQTMPLTVIWTLVSAIVLSRFYRCGWRGFLTVLLACALLITLLGLNVSIMGLVALPRGDLYRIAELFGLILSIGGAYMALFAFLDYAGRQLVAWATSGVAATNWS